MPYSFRHVQYALLAGALAICWPLFVQAQDKANITGGTYFANGVASGDPTASSVVIWTRVTPADTEAKEATVRWWVSKDPTHTNLVQSGELTTTQKTDFTVKLDIQELTPGETYYYQFSYEGTRSVTGRTKTLPDKNIAQLGITLVSGSNYAFGFFNAYDAIAQDRKTDFVLHLGDYLYENGADDYGALSGQALNRQHEPKQETLTLKDYRERHALYKRDPASQKMHASHPLIVIWNDHEIAHQAFVEGATNHQKNEGNWSKRKKAAIQAFYEWMPVRNPKKKKDQTSLWRHYEFGTLASLTTLESRHSARSRQINYDDHLSAIESKRARNSFIYEILAAENRTLLSKDMNKFYSQSMQASLAKNITWRFVGNQTLMTRLHAPRIDEQIHAQITANQLAPEQARLLGELKKIGEYDLPINLDSWDGYPMARDEFYSLNTELGISDLIVLSGDSRGFWFNKLHNKRGEQVGYEVGTSSMTEPEPLEPLNILTGKLFDELITNKNREVVWTNSRKRGFTRLDISKERISVNFIGLSTVKQQNYETQAIKSVEISRSENKLQYLFE